MVLAGVLALSVGCAAGALVTMRFVKSPAEAAAEAQPPPSGPVTVAVERRVMRQTLVLRGQVEPETSTTIRAVGGVRQGKPVVTRLPVDVGATVVAGQVVAEVSGRPVLLLVGEAPAYRDLVPGAEGGDVAQLQAALRALGHGTGSDRKGSYGPGTKAAVTAAYAAVGYRAQPTGEDDDRERVAAQRRVRDAERALGQAKAQPGADVETAAQALEDAQEDLAEFTRRTGAMVPLGEVVFVPALPMTVVSIGGSVGSEVTGPLLTVAGGQLVVRGEVSRSDAEILRPGQRVEIVSETSGVAAAGVVATVGEPVRPQAGAGDGQEGGGQESGGQAPAAQSGRPGSATSVVVVRGEQALEPRLVGQNVRLTIEQASTPTEVLVVPLAAVSARADGQAQVVRVTASGQEERIAVTAGVSGGGYVEVRPLGGALAPGDRVVVGR
jgi:HlyD family secretion protein